MCARSYVHLNAIKMSIKSHLRLRHTYFDHTPDRIFINTQCCNEAYSVWGRIMRTGGVCGTANFPFVRKSLEFSAAKHAS